MEIGAAWARLGPLRWPAAYLVSLVVAVALGQTPLGVGNAIFLAGALWILASVGFIGAGGERRIRLVRNTFGVPISFEKLDPEKRRVEIATGVKVFLVGLALWAPLVVVALRA